MESGSFKTVWIIDDDPIARLIVRKKIERSEILKTSQEFEFAGDALQKLSLLESKRAEIPDLILLDLNMPMMSGWEFLDELTNSEVSVPISVIILTSSINPEDQTKSTDYPIVAGLLHKPLELEELHEMIKVPK